MAYILEMQHVQIVVPKASEDACKHFYGSVLGLEEIPKPAQLLKNGGAWYRVGNEELHVSIEDDGSPNLPSRRHVCYIVRDVSAAERELQSQGIEIISDRQAIEAWRRFYVRDPGGNRIEIAENYKRAGVDFHYSQPAATPIVGAPTLVSLHSKFTPRQVGS